MAAVIFTGAQLLKQQSGLVGIAYIRVNNYSSDAKVYNLASLKRGTGGRSSFNGIVATVFGSTGFIGRYVANKLGKIGTQLILPYRGNNYETMRLKLCGDLGQVLFQPYYLKDLESIDKALKYSNVVINLVGRDWETKNFSFQDVHVKGARDLARAAKKAGVEKFIHLSALNCDGPNEAIFSRQGSKFLSSKWEGEQAVLEEFPEATIFRPSDVYGQEDRFLRYYAHNWRRQGQYMPMWKNGEATIKQPVHVSDLAAGIVAAIKDPEAAGKVYQAVGPRRYQLNELVDWFYRVMRKDSEWGYKRYDMKYDMFFKLKVSLTQKFSPAFPVGNLHWERLEREFVTDRVNQAIPTLEDLGVNLRRMEDQVPWELKPFTYGLYFGTDSEEPVVEPKPPKYVS
ncbi:PREDICTED: NADH dehydrogenase [ubiquinone] 1 alpha subcomplex subunit 9, mitochondrial [Nicrophorus vespilloides]|uniref:NADH dehydrogenase [ubiquinone] 1 alpha subcomplex subunit 9, mitochondrial n=1 Tax=Nicrophorus vespilloides TaxID=110193 RepID=A0ABM1NIB1_NICVS|nr:PREDICTED: NADH dehydrogenase [ubiquinone] 1 alpha subcomplex subunit 9, mitochondrial [Nicrophorus vespilloides]